MHDPFSPSCLAGLAILVVEDHTGLDWREPDRLSRAANLELWQCLRKRGAARRRSDPPPFIAAAALDVANPLHMDGGIGVQFPSLLNSRILRRLDGKRLFHAAAKDRIASLCVR